jgi:hypothetical protein
VKYTWLSPRRRALAASRGAGRARIPKPIWGRSATVSEPGHRITVAHDLLMPAAGAAVLEAADR